MGQKSILFLTTTHVFKKELIGIKNKIIAQNRAMINLGYNVDFISIDEPNAIFINHNLLVKFSNKFLYSLFFFFKLTKALSNKSYDYIYIRNPFIFDQIGFLYFLRKHKASYIILELPTFPYKKERTSLYQRATYLSEFLFRGLYKRYIKIVLYSGNKVDTIFGINAFQIKHGGNFEGTKINALEKDFKKINLIAVASFSKWHGFERLLNGINDYKSNSNSDCEVHLFLVGDREPLFSEYKYFIESNRLENLITMTGNLQGKELEDIFQKCHIGIGSLGMHRIGLLEGSPLKSAEYAVRGIPFVVGYKDSTFFDKNYCFQISGDESPLNISDVIKWYKGINLEKESMRKFTLNNFSWENQLFDILSIKKKMSNKTCGHI